MSITGTVKTMQEQNEIFAEKEPNYFKRVHMMANDIKKCINERLEMEHSKEIKKHGTEVGVTIRQNNS